MSTDSPGAPSECPSWAELLEWIEVAMQKDTCDLLSDHVRRCLDCRVRISFLDVVHQSYGCVFQLILNTHFGGN